MRLRLPGIPIVRPPRFPPLRAQLPPVPYLARRSFLGGLTATLACLPGFASAGAIRRLTLVRPASGEILRNVPFWWDDAPFEPGLAKLDWLMRDVYAQRVRPIDMRLFYLLAMLQAEFGGRPILVTSGYRTRATNEWLRSQGIGAARDSFHLRGRAVDIKLSGVPLARVAAFGSLLGLGGVGLYGAFVHLDTGPKRIWRG